ncbi:UNVERIFIED_CONTAM: hypothetical protein Sangu_2365100 [Sesamum angustifolium]|uniref:Uncharacterized protein n=1 Tax=Sesamum angustifolium TaxID=2727405 RepID=A0AAW2KWF0_9LAMI
MACTNPLHAAFFYEPKFSSSRRQNSGRASTLCSIHVRSSSTTLDHPTSRRSDMLRAIDQTDHETVFRTGKFGRFGGMFVPETLVLSLNKLAAEFRFILHDPDFQVHQR